MSATLGLPGSSLLLTGAVCPPCWGFLGAHFCRQVRCVRHVGASWKLTFVDRCGVSAPLGASGSSLLSTGAVCPPRWGLLEVHFCRQVRCVRHVGASWKLTFADRCGVSATLGPPGSSLLSTVVMCPPHWGLPEAHLCRQVQCVRCVGASWKLTFVDRCGVSATSGPPGN